MRTEEKIFTNAEGHFSIRAVAGDELRFVKKNYERASKIVGQQNFYSSVSVVLKASVITIQEVEVDKFKATGNIKNDSKSLNKSQKILNLNNEISEYVKNPYTEVLPKATIPNDFKSPIVSGGFAIGAIEAKWNIIDFVKWIKNTLGKEYFYSMELKEEEIDYFIQKSLKNIETKNILKYGYCSDSELAKVKIEMEKLLISYRNQS